MYEPLTLPVIRRKSRNLNKQSSERGSVEMDVSTESVLWVLDFIPNDINIKLVW